jgi:hypothetical protein
MVLIAHTFGCTAHLSPLLRKVRALGFAEADALLCLAGSRGCHHYSPAEQADGETLDPGSAVLSNEELGIAMISGSQEHDPRLIRCAAQLLSGIDISATKLARLARMERCEPLLSYIARNAVKWDSVRRDFWLDLLEHLPRTNRVSSDLWPHPSRFLIQAGYQRGGGVPDPVWLRPRMREVSR